MFFDIIHIAKLLNYYNYELTNQIRLPICVFFFEMSHHIHHFNSEYVVK